MCNIEIEDKLYVTWANMNYSLQHFVSYISCTKLLLGKTNINNIFYKYKKQILSKNTVKTFQNFKKKKKSRIVCLKYSSKKAWLPFGKLKIRKYEVISCIGKNSFLLLKKRY